MPLDGAVFTTLAGLLAGRTATLCPRLAQKFSTAVVTASATIRRRSGVAAQAPLAGL
jgi:hypothetical protein